MMYFYKLKGKQMLDLRGDLVLSHNDGLVVARYKSASPKGVRNATYVVGIPKLSTWGKINASLAALRFIWTAKSQALDPIEEEI